MLCPKCEATMQELPFIGWCPRCGTLTIPAPEMYTGVTLCLWVPKIVEIMKRRRWTAIPCEGGWRAGFPVGSEGHDLIAAHKIIFPDLIADTPAMALELADDWWTANVGAVNGRT